MDTALFLIFCAGAIYVCFWVVINERKGNLDGEWGLLGIRKPKETPDTNQRSADTSRR